MSSCEEAVKALGEVLYARRLRQMLLAALSRQLYGETIPARELSMRLYWDLERGILEVRDGQLCRAPRGPCVDLREVVRRLREYYRLSGQVRNKLRDLEFICREEMGL